MNSKFKSLGKKGNSSAFKLVLNTKIMPMMERVAKQKHLNALRNAFVAFLPFVLAGSIAMVLCIVIFGGVGGEKTSFLGLFANWDGTSLANHDYAEASRSFVNILFPIFRATIGHISIFIAFLIGYSLAKIKGFEHPIFAGLVTFSAFIVFTVGGDLSANVGYFGSKGVLTAIIAGMIVSELFMYLMKSEKLHLKMPSSVPQGVANSFKVVIPVFLTLLIVVGIQAIVMLPTKLAGAERFTITNMKNELVTKFSEVNKGQGWSIADLINIGVQSPFLTLATIQGADLGIAMLYVLMVGCFWFFGIHGASVMNGVFLPIFTVLALKNSEAFVANTPNYEYAVFAKNTFDAFIWFGGSGATLALLLGTLVLSKNKQEKEVAKFATPAGVFNINEPVIFGYPIVLNPIYAVPFILGPVTITITTWLALGPMKAVDPVIAIMPWTSPIGLGALFVTGFDYKAVLLALVNFIIMVLFYLPFVIFSSRVATKEARRKLQMKKNKLHGKMERERV